MFSFNPTSEPFHFLIPPRGDVAGQMIDLPGAATTGNVATFGTESGNNSRNVGSGKTRSSSPLGRIAESSPTREKPRSNDNPQDRAIQRRYNLLKTAQRLLPGERIAECQCAVAPLSEYVVASYDPERQSARYQNLVDCESSSCPVSAIWKSERDRRKLSVLLAEAEKRDLFPVMVTLTLRHKVGDSLDELRRALHDAYEATFSRGSWYTRLCDEYGIVSRVTAYEVTYGANGWHPHIHMLMFMSLELSGRWIDEFESKLGDKWLIELQRRGYDATKYRGVQVDTADSKIADYIAKYGHEPLDLVWGAEHEIAKAPIKRAHKDGLTPFELLGAAGGDKAALERMQLVLGMSDRKALKKRAAALYVEYFYSFKGKARLYIPAKLQEWLKTDSAIAALAASERPEVPMVMCSRDAWKDVARRDLEAELLIASRNAGLERDPFKLMIWLRENKIGGVVPAVALEWSQSGNVATCAGGSCAGDSIPVSCTI